MAENDKDKRPAGDASDDADTGTENTPIPATEGPQREETKEERRAR